MFREKEVNNNPLSDQHLKGSLQLNIVFISMTYVEIFVRQSYQYNLQVFVKRNVHRNIRSDSISRDEQLCHIFSMSFSNDKATNLKASRFFADGMKNATMEVRSGKAKVVVLPVLPLVASNEDKLPIRKEASNANDETFFRSCAGFADSCVCSNPNLALDWANLG